jgi:hypothetical protein
MDWQRRAVWPGEMEALVIMNEFGPTKEWLLSELELPKKIESRNWARQIEHAQTTVIINKRGNHLSISSEVSFAPPLLFRDSLTWMDSVA